MSNLFRLPHLSQAAIVTLVLTFASAAFCDSPLPKKFGHTFEELQSEANKRLTNDPKFGSEQLIVEYQLIFNDKGACEESVREVWVSRLKDTGDQGTVQRSYSPWFQNQPTYSAKIFDRNGKSYEVKDEDIIVSSIQSVDRTVLSDDLLLQAVLPGLQEGGIVEELTVTSERVPFFKSGAKKSYLLDTFVPTHYLSITIEAPETLPLKIGVLGPEIPITHATKDGKQLWTVEIHNPRLIDASKLEGNIPADKHSVSSLVITTGQSWNRIAAEYSDIVDQKLEGTDFKSIIDELDIDPSSAKQNQIEKCKQWIQSNIRYTSVALGSASIIPAKPLQVLTKRFGDCKDQSSLLVGMLRELKIESSVALVNSSTYRTPYEDYPALNSFNHAIVMARYDDREIWIDCTYPGSNAQSIPVYLQGKNALIASPETQGLTKITALPKETNRYFEERILRVSDDYQSHSMEVRTKSSGFFAAQARNEALTVDRAFREQDRIEQYKSLGGATEFKIESEDDPWNDSVTEFNASTKTTGIPFALNQSQRRITLSMLRLFDYLPEAYLMTRDESETKVERSFPAPVLVPFSFRRTTLIPPSNGITFQANEDRIEEKIGIVNIRKSIERRSGGELSVDFEVSSDAGELSVKNLEQLAKIIEEMQKPTNRWLAVVTLVVDSENELANLTASELIKLKEQWNSNDSDETLSKYIKGLIACGLVDEARRILENQANKTPDRPVVFLLLGQAYITDILGREFEVDCQLSLAEESLRKAVMLDPKNRVANHYLTNCLVRDTDGTFGTTPQREAECLELIKNYQTHSELSDGMFQIAVWLYIKQGDFQSAKDLFRKYNREAEEQSIQLIEWSLQEKWNEISALRDQLADDPEYLKSVFNVARNYLFELRQYKAGGRLFELETPNDASQRRLAASVANLRASTRPIGNPTSPKEVAEETVYRLLINGVNKKDWDSFILNPKEQDIALESLANALSLNRIKIRLNGLNKGRMFDSMEIRTKVDGTDDIGFRCEVTVGGKIYVMFVVKSNDQYKLLLRGDKLGALSMHASDLARNGQQTGAVKWLEWIMKEIPNGIALIPESFSPAKAIWNSSRTKTPEHVDRVLKILVAQGSPDELIKEFHEWIATEKSNTKKVYYQRALLDHLWKLDRALFAKEAEEFLTGKDGYLEFKTLLINFYTEAAQSEHANELLQEWGDQFPSPVAAQLEAKVLYHQGNEEEGLLALKEATTLYNSESNWNSLLWTALFSDRPTQELWDDCKDMFSPDKIQIATLHTIACVKAQTGNISDAMLDLNSVINQQGNVIKSADWLVIGLIAEQCEFATSAVKAYEKVEIDNAKHSPYDLAQRRLKKLQ